MKRKTLVTLVLVLFLSFFSFAFATNERNNAVTVSTESANDNGTFFDKISDLFFPSDNVSSGNTSVYLGGIPIGITVDGEGVTIIGLNEFMADGKFCCPSADAGLQINDIIVEIDGRKIYNSATLVDVARQSDGRTLNVKFLRKNQQNITQLVPQKEFISGNYKLGILTRDASSGIGTLTFVKTDMRYGALGHPICDQNGEIISTRNGNIYNASISGVIKGEKGKAGELRGTFAVEEKIGSLVNNCKYGVYGKLDSLPTELSKKDLIKVASPYEVKPGKATVYSTLDENGRMEYEIEIVKVSTQNMKGDKGLVLRVSDTRLLEKTGGIVQGMSGSPIVQNGKLVGAVTHVFINDPTKGYGVLGQWMLDNN